MKHLLITCFCTLTSLWLWSQDHIAQEVRVNLVELDVKVTDWRGRFISQLQADEFEIKEDGNTQKIDSFEEVRLDALSPQDADAYQSRFMLVLDMKNTSHSSVMRVIPQIRRFANKMFNGHHELGLAINNQGMVEVQSFTDSREVFLDALKRVEGLYKKSKFRSLNAAASNQAALGRRVTPGYAQQPVGQDLTLGNADIQPNASQFNQLNNAQGFQANRVFTGGYYFGEIKVLEQFINYLSAYTGKKNIILVSQLWNANLEDKHLRDIVTTCLRHRISINVVGLDSSPSISEDRFQTSAANQPQKSEHSSLAAATSGYFYSGNHRKTGDFLLRTVKENERYYRIRYYSDSKDRAFRKIKVKVSGKGRLVETFAGYHPTRRNIRSEEAKARLGPPRAPGAHFSLKMDTSWMSWSRDGLNKRQAYFALAQRAYGEDGRLLGERVDAGQLRSKKRDGAFPAVPLEKSYALDANREDIARLELVVVDLNSGREVTLSQSFKQLANLATR